MLFVPLAADVATVATDSTPYIISVLASCVAGLSGLVTTIALAKASNLTKAVAAEEKARHALELDVERLKGDRDKKDALTNAEFKYAMAAQNKELAAQTELLNKHDARLAAIAQDLVGHEEQLRRRSQSQMLAVRVPPSPPIPRQDGPSHVVQPYDPGLPRPRLKSQQTP